MRRRSIFNYQIQFGYSQMQNFGSTATILRGYPQVEFFLRTLCPAKCIEWCEQVRTLGPRGRIALELRTIDEAGPCNKMVIISVE